MKKLKNLLAIILSLFLMFGATACDVVDQILAEIIDQTQNVPQIGSVGSVDLDLIGEYKGSPFIYINDNVPIFTDQEKSLPAREEYSELDILGRCGVVFAVCGKEIMPAPDEERGSISNVYPTGWKQNRYDSSLVNGGWLYNRSHLIGWQLSAENANKRNLITGTRYFNVDGMLPFENMVADYIKETNNHVAYRVSPIFDGTNLLCHGVQMEAYSIQDNGDGVCFNVFVYNVQPGIEINYATGENRLA